MQTTTDEFTRISQADVRELNFAVRMSFDKVFDDDINFFEIGTSVIGGSDFIPGTGDVVQEWDKYTYIDVSGRVTEIEWQREVKPFSGFSLGMADVVFDNYDDYFTPGGSSEVADYILPYRPIRIYAGFGADVIPVFIGLTEKMPEINEKSKTATFHCVDFLYSILERPLLESAMYVGQTTDTIISNLLQLVGLSTLQFELDTGFLTVPYASFRKDEKLKHALEKILQAEQGRLYLDEQGTIRFKNRQNISTSTIMSLNAYTNIVDYKTLKQDQIINVAEVKSHVVEVGANQEYYELPIDDPITVPAGGSFEVWVDIGKVTGVDAPVYIDSATTSSFSVNTASDGSGSANSTDVTLSSSSLLGESFKMTFANANVADLYITDLRLFATPVIKGKPIYVVEENASSKTKYDERVKTIENEYIQTEADATSLATTVLSDYAIHGRITQLKIKGTPALQVDDAVHVNLYDNNGDFRVMKIMNKISQPAKYEQYIEVKELQVITYFTIGTSLIGGDDQIKP